MARPVLTGLLAGLLAAPASARDVVQCCRCKSKGLCKFGLSDCEEGKAIEVHTAFLEGEKDTDCKLKILGTERKNWFHEDNPNEPDKKLSILLSDRHPDDALRAVLGGGDSRQLIVTVGNFPKLKERVTTRGKTEIGKLQKQLDKEKKEKEDAEELKKKKAAAWERSCPDDDKRLKFLHLALEKAQKESKELEDELASVEASVRAGEATLQEVMKEAIKNMKKAVSKTTGEEDVSKTPGEEDDSKTPGEAIKNMQEAGSNTTGEEVTTGATARGRRTRTRWHKPLRRFIKNFLKN